MAETDDRRTGREQLAEPTPVATVRLVLQVRSWAPSATAVGALVIIATRRYVWPANADALLPALMSTQQWTLFYWGQDRLANLIPLLAMPVRDPIWNFQIQTLIIASAFFGLGAIFVSYHTWSRRERIRPIEHAIATGLAGLLVMAPMHTIAGYRFLVEQLYFVSVLCWVAAVWAWHRRHHYVFGGILVQVATLVNPSLLLASPLVWLLDDRAEGRLRRCAGFVAVAVSAFVSTNVAAHYLGGGPEVDLPYNEFRLEHLRTGMQLVAGNIAGSMRDHLASGVVIGAVAVIIISARRLPPRSVAVYIALPLFSFGWFVAFSTNGWVIQNLHEFRYFYPLYVTFVLYVAGAATELVLATRRWRPSLERAGARTTSIAAVEVALLGAVACVAIISIHRVDVPALDTTEGAVAAARQFDSRLVAGNYWSTWPTVVAGRSEGLDLLGVSLRNDPIAGEVRDEILDSFDRNGTVSVVCSGVDSSGCVEMVNQQGAGAWTVDQIVLESPLVIRIVPLG